MTTEEKIKGLEHLLRKCPDVITALEASRLIHVSKNSIHAAIGEGKLYDPDFVTGHFGQLLKKHNLKKIRFHDLCHSCASVLLARGVPMKQI